MAIENGKPVEAGWVNSWTITMLGFASKHNPICCVDAFSARLHADLYQRKFSAVCHFNDTGELINFVSEDRYQTVGKEYLRNRWRMPFWNYREVGSLHIPSEGKATWHLPEGNYSYIKIKIEDERYVSFGVEQVDWLDLDG